MYPASFAYVRAESLEHAIKLLAEHGEGSKLLAGGASLIPLMKLRLASPAILVDIGGLRDELAGITRTDGRFRIGALVRHVEVEDATDLGSAVPLLHDVAAQIGDPQVRNMGTLGGSIAECDPAGDWGPGLLALDAVVECLGPTGSRSVPAADFFVDAYTTTLRPDEVITGVVIDAPPARSGSAHLKLERRAGDFAVASCSIRLTLDELDRCTTIGIGLGGIAMTPIKAVAAEELLRGQELSDALVDEAGRVAIELIESFSDIRGSAEYRRHVAGVLLRRAVAVARRRAGGETVEVTHG